MKEEILDIVDINENVIGSIALKAVNISNKRRSEWYKILN